MSKRKGQGRVKHADRILLFSSFSSSPFLHRKWPSGNRTPSGQRFNRVVVCVCCKTGCGGFPLFLCFEPTAKLIDNILTKSSCLWREKVKERVIQKSRVFFLLYLLWIFEYHLKLLSSWNIINKMYYSSNCTWNDEVLMYLIVIVR